MSEMERPNGYPNQEKVNILEAELQSIQAELCPNIVGLVETELFNLRGGISNEIDLINNSKIKVRSKVCLPQDGFNVNYVGRLLGPRGETLKNLQATTSTKMAILGKGSMRDEIKEQEMLASGDPKFQHLKQNMHLQIDSTADPAEAYYRMSYALAEVKKCIDEITNAAGGSGGFGQRGSNAPRGRGRGAGMGGGAALVSPQMGYQSYPQPVDNSYYGAPNPTDGFGTSYAEGDLSAGKFPGRGRGRGRGGAPRPYGGRGGRP
jgi:hypothetical protein